MAISLPRWIAHRGGGALAPENTLAGIRLAARLGFQAVEFDVMLSADGVPFLIHDETLERTTNGRGRVCETTAAELQALDAGGGEPPPLFADAALLCRQLGLLANVEIKPAAGFERQTGERVAVLAAELWAGAPVLPLLSSFSLLALQRAKALAPHLPRGVLFERVPEDGVALCQSLGAATLHCHAGLLDDGVVSAAESAGLPILCYTVNVREEAVRLFERGVAGVFTDRLDLYANDTSAYKGLHLGG